MFLYREVVSLLRLRPTLRTQLTLLYGGLLAVLAGGLLFLIVPLQGSASVQDGPHAAAITAALNTTIRQKEIIAAIALPVVVLLAVVGGWLIAGRLLRPLRTITATAKDGEQAAVEEGELRAQGRPQPEQRGHLAVDGHHCAPIR